MLKMWWHGFGTTPIMTSVRHSGGRFSAIIAWLESVQKRLTQSVPGLFRKKVGLEVIRIEFAGEVTVGAIFILHAALEAAELKSCHLDVDRREMRLYADVFIETAAEKHSAEMLRCRFSGEGKAVKRPSLN